MSASPALGATPEAWPDSVNDSGVVATLKFAAWTLGIVAVVWLLVMLPSVVRGNKADAKAFAEQPEWFGGPHQGADAAKSSADNGSETGGSGGNW